MNTISWEWMWFHVRTQMPGASKFGVGSLNSSGIHACWRWGLGLCSLTSSLWYCVSTVKHFSLNEKMNAVYCTWFGMAETSISSKQNPWACNLFLSASVSHWFVPCLTYIHVLIKKDHNFNPKKKTLIPLFPFCFWFQGYFIFEAIMSIHNYKILQENMQKKFAVSAEYGWDLRVIWNK